MQRRPAVPEPREYEPINPEPINCSPRLILSSRMPPSPELGCRSKVSQEQQSGGSRRDQGPQRPRLAFGCSRSGKQSSPTENDRQWCLLE